MPKGGTARFKAFLAAYGGEAALNGTKACRMAGYSEPERAFQRLKRTQGKAIEEVEVKFREDLKVGWEEAQELLAAVARNPRHKDQLKAIELVAKLHGKLDPKLDVRVTRSDVEQRLAELLSQMALNQGQVAPGAAVPQLPQPDPDSN
jgi:hypothetical protein